MGTQKVVIPKGLVNPGETTIVEIPANLQNVGTVVARPRAGSPGPSQPFSPYSSYSSSYSSSAATPGSWVSPSTPPPKPPKKRTYMRKTLPRTAPQTYGALHEAGITFGGIPNEEDSSMEESPYKFKIQIPRQPGDRRGELSEGDVFYAVCKPPPYGVRGAFDPPAGHNSTMGEIGYRETSLYRDFKPKAASPLKESPEQRTPGSVKHWHSSLGTVSPDPISSPEYVYDEDDYEYSELSPINYTGKSAAYNLQYPSPDTSSSIDYKRYEGPEYAGMSSGSSSPGSPGSPGSPESPERKITQREVMNSLGELEATELSQIMGDLNQFQNARRRLVFDASSLASAADVSSNLLSSTV